MGVALETKRSLPATQNTAQAMLLLISILSHLSASLPRVVRHQHAACGAVFIYGHCCTATEKEEPEAWVEVEGQNRNKPRASLPRPLAHAPWRSERVGISDLMPILLD